MKSTLKFMFAALFASAASFGITEDSAGGVAAVAAEPAPPVAPVPSLTDKIDQFFESSDKRHLKEAMLMIANSIDELRALLSHPENAPLTPYVADRVDERLAAIEQFIGLGISSVTKQ